MNIRFGNVFYGWTLKKFLANLIYYGMFPISLIILYWKISEAREAFEFVFLCVCIMLILARMMAWADKNRK